MIELAYKRRIRPHSNTWKEVQTKKYLKVTRNKIISAKIKKSLRV